jgi:hypothetical protein
MVTAKLTKVFATIMKEEGNERTTQTIVGKCQELWAASIFRGDRPETRGMMAFEREPWHYGIA